MRRVETSAGGVESTAWGEYFSERVSALSHVPLIIKDLWPQWEHRVVSGQRLVMISTKTASG